MMMKKISLYILIAGCLLGLGACKKDLLDEKPSKALLVPTEPADFRALLDNNQVFNYTPALTAYADGDFYTTAAGYNSFGEDQDRNSYLWAKDIFANEPNLDWTSTYKQVFYANIVLEGLAALPAGKVTPAEFNALRGEALFDRALAFFGLVKEFAPQYHAASAATDLGIPIRLDADVTQKTQRSTLATSYEQIISDFSTARQLLPVQTIYKSRPSLATTYAMLSRVYLSMQDYAKAGSYADSCLQQSSELIDYNTLSETATRPFPRILPNGNPEALYYAVSYSYTYSATSAVAMTDPALYDSYVDNDLRKTILFRPFTTGTYKFKGNYAGILVLFSGPATDEMYLTRAECKARAGNAASALADLNTVLVKRWKTGTFVNLTAPDAEKALALILVERRKELTGRNLRWTDLRRLNDDPRFAVTLTRELNGVTYTLTPNSPRYVYPIPPDEMKANPMVQNQR